MKFTQPMLRDYVSTVLSPHEVGDLLTMTGLELEEITEVEGEPVLDVNIMANRGDAASVIGMAREVLAKAPGAKPTSLYLRAIDRFPATDAASRDVWAHASVRIETKNCTRFACRIFPSVTNGPSPDWLQKRLRQIGQRPISLLVDLTNYVMFETGQPLHAYDLDLLQGGIMVRDAKEGEKLTTLDGIERELTPGQVMICDDRGPIGVGGVMGGSETEVSASTTRCLLEAAHFTNTSVRKTRNQLGLQTEASYRFERHVDPEGVVAALNRFAELLESATGARPVGGVVDVWPTKLPTKTVKVGLARCNKILGLTVPFDEAKRYLQSLGFVVAGQDGEALNVVVPTWRADIAREEDLIEEIGRVHGYEKIPSELPIGSTPVGGAHGHDALIDRLRMAAVREGFDQCISHSLRDKHPLDSSSDRTVVRTPLAPEMAHLRNSLLPSLCDAALRNGGKDAHLFEIGKVFCPDERASLAWLSTGRFEPQEWRKSDDSVGDFFTLKGSVTRTFANEGLRLDFSPLSDDPRLHPGRSAVISVAGVQVGVMGEIHPLIAEATDLPEGTAIAEFDLDALRSVAAEGVTFRSVSRNPAVRRDIAVMLDRSVPFAKVEQDVRDAVGEVLEKLWLVDVYTGAGIPEGKHSLAIGLQLRKMGANFTDEEANQVRDAVVQALESLGAKLR